MDEIGTTQHEATLRFLASRPDTATKEEITAALDTTSGAANQVLRQLVGEGKVERVKRGIYRLARPLEDVIPSGDGSHTVAVPVVADGGVSQPPEDDTPPGPESMPTAARMTSTQLRRLGLTRVPRLTIEASAGPGYEVTVEAVDVDAAPFIISEHEARARYGVSAADLHTIPVRGDSMEPTLRAGDEALVARVYPGTPLRDGMIYTLGSPDGVLIKRLRFESEAVDDVTVRRFVWIVSDNKDAASYRVPVAVFERDYKVVAAFLTVLRSL